MLPVPFPWLLSFVIFADSDSGSSDSESDDAKPSGSVDAIKVCVGSIWF